MATIYLGADHAGFELKEKLKPILERKHTVIDCGNHVHDPDDDYPVWAAKVGYEVSIHDGFGIVICGTAEGVCIAANKIPGIRAIAAANPTIAKLARQHNAANVLCLAGGRMKKRVPGIGLTMARAKKIIETFLNTQFSGEERHKRRLAQLRRIEARC